MRSTGTSVLFAALGAVCCLGTSFGEENRINETADRLVLHTDDGLNLVLTRTHGAVDAIAVDGHDFPCGGVPLIRFEEVVESPDAPDLLAVGGTARDAPADPASLAADWGVPEDSVVDSVDGEAGPWLEVSGQDTVRPKRTVAISQREAGPLVLSGWCQARVKGEALGWWNRNLALNADVAYAYGRRMPEQSAYFGQYDHGPQFNARVICPDTPIERVEVDLSVPGGDCTAWYRDVRLRPAQYRITHPTSPLERIDACVHQEFTLEKPGLDGLVTLEPTADRIEIRCQFYGTAPLERAVSAYVAIPIDAVGGVWHDHVRGSRRIEEGGIYRDAVWYGAGRDGYNSRYPLACIETADGVGLALGVSVAEPRVHQFEYDAGRRELRIRFDFGLSPDAGQWANRASFTAYLYRYDAADGFRGAADKYHRMFGWAFAKRVEREGLWLAFMTPTAIDRDGWEAFRFQFLESVGHMGWDERQGMYSFRYAEPWIHHHEFPPGVEAE